MKCGHSGCSENVALVINSICERREVAKASFCEEHGRLALNAYYSQHALPETACDPLLEFDIELIVSDGNHQVGAVYLRQASGDCRLGLACGILEASLVSAAITMINPPRPLTHDAMLQIAHSLGAEVAQVSINQRLSDGNTFKAAVRLVVREASVEVDMRPTDALCLAVRSGARIYVASSLLT